MNVYGKIIGVLVGAFFISQFLNRSLFLNASPQINPNFLAQLPKNVGNFLASPLGGNGSAETNTETGSCTDPTGTETYDNAILAIGPHIAANNNPANFKQIRKLYNCENNGNTAITGSYIPVTVVYDLLYLKGSVAGIQANLVDMKKYGLFPIIRVSSYTDGTGKWIKIGNEDAKIMGQNLAQALNAVSFPDSPSVIYLNEVNLNVEWGGQTNPAEVASSFAAFVDGIGQGAFRLYFPSLSYGGNSTNGMTPADFLSGFFAASGFSGKKINGVSLNIYGSDYASIQTQYVNQSGAFNSYLSYFNGPPSAIISELGPTDSQSIIYNCADPGPWPTVSGPIFSGFNANPVASYATTTCFQGDKIYLTIIHADGSDPHLVPFEVYGGAQNNSPTSTPGPTSANPTPTLPPGQNPTATPVPAQPTTPPNPTRLPGNNQGGTVKVIIHIDSPTGTIWNGESKIDVYLEGPSSKGNRFGETLSIFGTDKTSCKSKGGFPYSCITGTAEWKGADGTSGTAAGDYSVHISSTPLRWTGVEGASSEKKTLLPGQSITLDLAVMKSN